VRSVRWSLRTWILLPAILVVTAVTATGALLQLDTLLRAWVNSTRQIAELAGQQITQLVLLRGQLENDPELTAMLETSAAGGNSIVEISIADRAEVVLASSNRSRIGRRSALAQPLGSLPELNAFARLRALFTPAAEYELRIPLGAKGETVPVYTIQVLVSGALLREIIGPGLERIAITALLVYLAALAVVYAGAEFTRANLVRIGKIIDRIGAGTPVAHRPHAATAEFAAVESKLSLMQDRVRGALDDAESYRRRVSALLTKLEESILLCDGDRLLLCVGAVEPLMGFNADRIVGRRLSELNSSGIALASLVQESLQSNRPVRNRILELQDAHSPRRLLVNVDLLNENALIRLRDAEGAGEVESQLQLSSRLEAINRLTGGVAHEIKNPLNSIAARLALIEDMVASEVPEAEEEIRVIAEEIERLDRVVRTFLDFTQPLEIARKDVDLVHLARDVTELVRPDAANRSISVTLETEAAEVRVLGDRDLLKQAVLNLAVNGIEAMTEGGELRIHVARNGSLGLLRISDTGTGIPEAVRQKIFNLYFTTKKNGSGIGLAVAYRTLQLHGGDIRLETEPGKGSTFELRLPLA
jgi:signal transduction histidine kinase